MPTWGDMLHIHDLRHLQGFSNLERGLLVPFLGVSSLMTSLCPHIGGGRAGAKTNGSPMNSPSLGEMAWEVSQA